MVNDTQARRIGRRGFLHTAGVGATGLAALAGTVAAQTSSGSSRGSGHSVATQPVITRRVGRSDRSLAAVGLGTFLTFDLLPGAERDALRHVTQTYLDAGVDVVDTSPLYGTGEASLGTFLAERGTTERLFVSNKVWSTGEFLADESHALRSFEQSQLRLWRQSMDVMFCHSLVNVDVVMPMLAAWKKEGRVRNVGISHHENAYHDIIADTLVRGSIDMVQINYSIFNRSAERRVLPIAAERGVGVFLNMVLEKGRLHKLVQGQALPAFAAEIGAENWSQFFIKWALGHPAVTTALTATSSPEHARENVGALRGPVPNAAMRQRMVAYMETIPGFNQLASMPWYPDKQAQYQGVIRRQQYACGNAWGEERQSMRAMSRQSQVAFVAWNLFAATSHALAQSTRNGVEERVAFARFTIDRTEVTVARFRAFARSTGLKTAAEREGGGFEFTGGWVRRPGWTFEQPQGSAAADDEPAVHVSWHEASRYCAHVGGRLPSWTEWRLAAYTEQRSTPQPGFVTGRTYAYPVGDLPEGMNNNRRSHLGVGRTRIGVNGLYDMGGNVWEWLADRQGPDALTAGGSWWYGPEQTRAEGAQWKSADFYAVYVGFRCVYNN